jgi:hypothetical protein
VDLKYCILSIAQVLCNGQRFGICCAVGGIFPSPVQNHIFSEEQLHNAWASAGGKSNCDGEFFACCLGACTACITPYSEIIEVISTLPRCRSRDRNYAPCHILAATSLFHHSATTSSSHRHTPIADLSHYNPAYLPLSADKYKYGVFHLQKPAVATFTCVSERGVQSFPLSSFLDMNIFRFIATPHGKETHLHATRNTHEHKRFVT